VLLLGVVVEGGVAGHGALGGGGDATQSNRDVRTWAGIRYAAGVSRERAGVVWPGRQSTGERVPAAPGTGSGEGRGGGGILWRRANLSVRVPAAVARPIARDIQAVLQRDL